MANKIIERAVSFGRACQSPRTGFLHLFDGTAGGDTIPLYENFCFATALIRQKTIEGVYEGKELLERLFAFQTEEGNFPNYLHEYPRCWNRFQPLRIAPLFKLLLKEFGHVFSESFKDKMTLVLHRMITSVKPSLPPVWDRRYRALLGEAVAIPDPLSSDEIAQDFITAQLLENFCGQILEATRLIHPHLHVYAGPCIQEMQEGGEPRPSLLEVARLNRPHPLHLELATLYDEPKLSDALWSGRIGDCEILQGETDALVFSASSVRWIWQGEGKLHSLVVPAGEMAIYCDQSPQTELFVEGKKATAFRLEERVMIQTPGRRIHLQFKLLEGEGNFFGHISQSNRPLQSKKGHEAYDWKISLRTLRSKDAKLSLVLSGEELPCPSHEDHCRHIQLLL